MQMSKSPLFTIDQFFRTIGHDLQIAANLIKLRESEGCANRADSVFSAAHLSGPFVTSIIAASSETIDGEPGARDQGMGS